jgi:lipopolysaccharide/colanic/teichoic acid biosynthesis glycosyltransferase
MSAVHVVVTDLRQARQLGRVARRAGVHLHLCGDAAALERHLAWIAEQAGDASVLVLPDDLHPLPGARLDWLPAAVRRILEVRFGPSDAAARGWLVAAPELSALLGWQGAGADLEGVLRTKSAAGPRLTARHAPALALRAPGAYGRACALVHRDQRPRHSPRGEGPAPTWPERLLAGGLLVLATPIIGVAALAVRLESRGPAFFRQFRVGGDRRRASHHELGARGFHLFKVRTMRRDAESTRSELLGRNAYAEGPFFKLADDPRVTRVGRMLRRLGIDELPQLLNVVRGELRLVGNRPLPVYEAHRLDQPWQRLRFEAPSGITGLWQVAGRRAPHWRQRVFLDNQYALERSRWLDVSIVLSTIPAMLRSRGRE